MKKVLLIGDSPLNDSPYIRSYIEVLEQNNIPYDLLFWNRHLDSTEQLPENYISYNLFTDNKYPFWKRLYNIRKFARFASKWICKNDYAYVVVFTIAHAIFMRHTLQKKYQTKYVFDIRDYSPLCKIGYFRKQLERVVGNSAYTVVSSAGFLRWLPNNGKCRYVLAHNTTKGMLDAYVNAKGGIIKPTDSSAIKILTIGQISYYDSQECFVNHLANCDGFDLSFVGVGPASEPLKQYVEENKIKNISFAGRYEKKDEVSIVKLYHMINIWLKHSLNADSCMANRFYLSVLLRKPMIVTKASHQGELCERYGLGVVLDERDDFVEKIRTWWSNFQADKFEEGCQAFLKTVSMDVDAFEKELVLLYQANS